MIKFEDIKFDYTRYGTDINFIRVPIPEHHKGSSLKDKKRVDRSSMVRTRVVPCVFEYSGKLDDSRGTTFKFYLASKKIKSKRLFHPFATKREALLSIDMFLIREGKQPKHILKKND
jgi:hypothetical protein